MPSPYKVAHVFGLENQELLVHMCRPTTWTEDAVELQTVGGTCVVLSRAQFADVVKWVDGQFDELLGIGQIKH